MISFLGLILICSFSSNIIAINVDSNLCVQRVDLHDDFDLEKIKQELKVLMNEYTSSTNKQHQKQVIFSLESKLKSQISEYPKHEDQILKAARAMIEKGNHNWIILRNKTQLRIKVVPEQPATTKNG